MCVHVGFPHKVSIKLAGRHEGADVGAAPSKMGAAPSAALACHLPFILQKGGTTPIALFPMQK